MEKGSVRTALSNASWNCRQLTATGLGALQATSAARQMPSCSGKQQTSPLLPVPPPNLLLLRDKVINPPLEFCFTKCTLFKHRLSWLTSYKNAEIRHSQFLFIVQKTSKYSLRNAILIATWDWRKI